MANTIKKSPSVREIPLTHITIDPEFESLLSPLTGEELAQLEANLVAQGLRDPLIVWLNEKDGKFPLLDGHNRFQICNKHRELLRGEDERVPVCFVDLPDREAAKLWILENQVGKRNLTDDQRAMIWAEILAHRAKDSRREAPAKARAAKTEPVVAAKTPATAKRDTRGAVAKEAKLPEKKLRAARELKKADPELAQQVRDGKKTMREANAELDKKSSPPIPPSPPRQLSLALMFGLQSTLQKAIRRGDEREALLAAWQLDCERGNKNSRGRAGGMWSILRRICAEDVGLACIRVLEPIEALWRFWEKQVESLNNEHEPWRLFTVEAVLILCRSLKSRLVDHACVAIDKDRLQAIADEVRQVPQPHPIPEYADDGLHTAKKNGKTVFDFIQTEDSALSPKATDVEDPYKQQILDVVKTVAPSAPTPSASPVTDLAKPRSLSSLRREIGEIVRRALRLGWYNNITRRLKISHTIVMNELLSGEVFPADWKKGSEIPFTAIEIENIRKLAALYKQKASSSDKKAKRFTFPNTYQLSAEEKALAKEIATFPNIRSGFCALVRRHHPDYGGSSEKFQAVMRAYAYLKTKQPAPAVTPIRGEAA